MSNASPLRHAPIAVPRPSPSPVRPLPRLVSLSSLDLVEIREKSPSSMPPPLPLRRDGARRSEVVPVMRPSPRQDVLVGRLRDLDSEADALAAARACLQALELVVPSRASVVHAFDVTRRDFIVVDARGEAAESMLLQRSSKEDPLLRVAIPNGEPFPWNDLRKAPVSRLARFTGLPHVARVLVCPVLAGVRWLGAIELVDPAHDEAFRSRDVLAARYVAQRYAQYLTAHGMVLEVAAIARHAFRP